MRGGRLAAALAVLTLATPAAADSWEPPSRTIWLSRNSTARVTIDPVPGTATARAQVERFSAPGRWSPLWSAPLINIPVYVSVRDDGRALVTFDDWGCLGLCGHAVTVYDARGRLVRNLSLAEVVPPVLHNWQRSVSSMAWRAGEYPPHFAGNAIVFAVRATPKIKSLNELARSENPGRLRVSVRLSDGAVRRIDPARWERAIAEARVPQAEEASWRARLARWWRSLLGRL